MEISQSGLFLLILYSAATGAVLGFLYDIIKLLRYVVFSPGLNYDSEDHRLISRAASKHSSKKGVLFAEWLSVAITDIAFMISCAISVILVAYIENMGRIRWLIPFGAVVGFALYRFTVGRLVIKMSVVLSIIVRAAFVLVAMIFERIFLRMKSIKIKEKTKKGRGKWHTRKKKDEIRITES